MSEDCFTAFNSDSEFPWGTLPHDLSQWPVSVYRGLGGLEILSISLLHVLAHCTMSDMFEHLPPPTHTHTHTQNIHSYIKLRDWTGSQLVALDSLELTV